MLLFAIGIVIGAIGTMIGAGGGFLLVPILLFLYPTEAPEVITAISLAVVFCNALAGSIAYIRRGRVDFQSAWPFTVISLPGALLGTWVTRWISRGSFDLLFGLLMVGAGLYLFLKRRPDETSKAIGRPSVQRQIITKDGHTFIYAYDSRVGLWISSGVGFISSFFGIGGGIIHVPAMVHLLAFPVHIATATSHFILAWVSLSATLIHALNGSLSPGLDRLLFLAPGVLIGAPLGARLSDKLSGQWILRGLALGLLAVGLRLVLLR